MRFLLGVLMLMISGSALATIDVLQFKDEAQEQQFRQLTEELRCPKIFFLRLSLRLRFLFP